jgi:hypothetical protein
VDAIDDRTLIETDNVQYVGVIHQDENCDNPITAWDHAERFEVIDGSKHEQSLFDHDPCIVHHRSNRVPEYIEQDAYDDHTVANWIKVYRRADPSGIYLAVRYDGDRYAGIAAWITDDDDDRANIIMYATSDDIRKEQLCKRITAKVRDQVRANMQSTLDTFNAWANGECYGWELLRQTVDEDDEVLESESIESCWGFYGDKEWEYMYSEALSTAQWHVAA